MLPPSLVLWIQILAETHHVDQAYSGKPYGDAADYAMLAVPFGHGLERGVVDDFEIFGLEF